MLAEMRRDMARLAWVREQIDAIEQARKQRLELALPHFWLDFLNLCGCRYSKAEINRRKRWRIRQSKTSWMQLLMGLAVHQMTAMG
jgi:hypothetical protein